MGKSSKAKHGKSRGGQGGASQLGPRELGQSEPSDAAWNRSDDDYDHADDCEENDDLDEDMPRVVMGIVADLGRKDLGIEVRDHEGWPIWVLLEKHASMMGVFERYPEDPGSDEWVPIVFDELRRFVRDHGEDLQKLLGATDALRIGFHTNAPLEDVVESFEDDGFDVLFGIEDGMVVLAPDSSG